MPWERVRLGLSILVLGVAAVSSATCAGDANDPLARTILMVDRGIDALIDPTADFRAVLHDLTRRLRPADTLVGAAINRFLDRVPTAGADFQCGADFVRLRARRELIRLEATLLSTATEPTEPQVCYAAPFAIDQTRPPSTLEIYGFDFDLVPLQMVLVTREGYRDVSTALTLRTHSHLTVQLGDRGVRLPANPQSLGLAWGNLIHHSVPIVTGGTPLCSCEIEEIPAGRTVEYAPSLVPGGRQPAAPATMGWASALVDYQSNELSATVCLAIPNSSGDRAVRSGCVRTFILTIAPERTIEWVFGRTAGRASYPAGSGPGDLLHRWTFAGFGADSAEPRVIVELGRIRLVSTGGEGCISPIAYLEARRNGAMSAVTMRALDRQLSNVDREILAIRPRFAPAIAVK